MKKKNILIIGSGGHSRVIIDCLLKIKYKIVGIIDINSQNKNSINEKIFGFPVLGGIDYLDNFNSNISDIFLAIGDNILRKNIYDLSSIRQFSIPTIIDINSCVSNFSTIGLGSYVAPGAIINAGAKVGMNSIINTGSIIEHEVNIGDFTHIGPGSKIAGRVYIGSNVHIGIGVSIKNNISIGDNAIIGAGSVVVKDVLKNTTVAGTPAKII